MISDEQRAFIKNLHDLHGGRERSPYAAAAIRHFALGAVYLHGYRVHRLRRNQSLPASTDMIVRAGDKLDEIASVASIVLWECADADAAYDHLLTVLCEIQSNAVKRDRQRDVGDMLFTLDDTLFLFVRANLTILVRNAGTRIFSLGEIARTIDAAIVRHLQKGEAP